MKRTLFFLITITWCVSLQAQITITGADLPQQGTAFTIGNKTGPVIDIGSASSSSQVWDFSSLTMDYPKFAVYSPTAPYHQYAANFTDANLYTYGPSFLFAGLYGGAPVDLTAWGYCYWQSDDSGLKIIGFRGNWGIGNDNVLENPQELLMGTPASLDSVFTDSARWIVEVAEVPTDFDTAYISTVQKTLTVDAFGTLTTPYGTYEVIRVHEYFIGIDTLKATIFGNDAWAMQLANDTLNNYYFWANGVGYPLATVRCDKNNQIIDAEWVSIKSNAYTISGQVFEPNGTTPITSGTVDLFARSGYDHLFGVEEKVNIVADGRFQFSCVTWGNWMLLADANEGIYPHLFPTYYGDSVTWESASYIANVASDIDVNITLKEDSWASIQTSGGGLIYGTVWYDTTQVDNKDLINAGRAGNVKVTLEENPGGAAIMHTDTDDQGDFEFPELADGNYQLRIEVAGVKMDTTHQITVEAGQIYYNNDFFYDTIFVYDLTTSVIEENSLIIETPVTIWPNPFIDNATVEVGNKLAAFDYEFSVFDLSGKKVKQFNGRTNDKFPISSKGLSSGLYLFELKVDNELIHTGKVLLEK